MNRPTTAPRHRRVLGVLVAAVVAPLASLALATAPAQATEVGSVGEVTVEPTEGLPAEGAEVVVRGTGFDPSSGVYVAVCVDNGPGEKPTPCIGGADTEGVGGAIWISDTPPSYAEGLTEPYGPDGSFEVTLPVPVEDPVTGTDCRVDPCAVTVRFDHLRAEDRGADHVVPVSFATEDDDASGAEETPTAEPTAAEPTATPVETPSATPSAITGAGSGEEDADGGMNLPLVGGLVALVVGGGLAAAVALRTRQRSAAGTTDDEASSSRTTPGEGPDA